MATIHYDSKEEGNLFPMRRVDISRDVAIKYGIKEVLVLLRRHRKGDFGKSGTFAKKVSKDILENGPFATSDDRLLNSACILTKGKAFGTVLSVYSTSGEGSDNIWVYSCPYADPPTTEVFYAHEY